MALLTTVPVLLVGILHVYIFVLEAFLWTTPKGMKTFGLSPTFAAQTRSLAANQGLYNGFLAAGLFWGAFHPVVEFGKQVQLFFCSCVFVAGVVGGATAKPKIFFVQGIPGLVALVTVLLF